MATGQRCKTEINLCAQREQEFNKTNNKEWGTSLLF